MSLCPKIIYLLVTRPHRNQPNRQGTGGVNLNGRGEGGKGKFTTHASFFPPTHCSAAASSSVRLSPPHRVSQCRRCLMSTLLTYFLDAICVSTLYCGLSVSQRYVAIMSIPPPSAHDHLPAATDDRLPTPPPRSKFYVLPRVSVCPLSTVSKVCLTYTRQHTTDLLPRCCCLPPCRHLLCHHPRRHAAPPPTPSLTHFHRSRRSRIPRSVAVVGR